MARGRIPLGPDPDRTRVILAEDRRHDNSHRTAAVVIGVMMDIEGTAGLAVDIEGEDAVEVMDRGTISTHSLYAIYVLLDFECTFLTVFFDLIFHRILN